MLNSRQTAALHNARSSAMVTAQEREQLIKPFLPEPRPGGTSSHSSSRESSRPPMQTAKRPRRKPIRTALKHGLYVFLFTAIHFFFSIYLRIRMALRTVKYRIFSIGL